MNNTVIIFGGDGYIGWSLAMSVAIKHPHHKVIIVDNQWRRNELIKLGCDSLVPIASMPERLQAFKEVHHQNNILFLKSDIDSKETDDLILTEKPHTIYHLAHQPSAPYSMRGVEEAIFTMKNNEAGNLRLLWAVRQYSPDTHIVKLGSMGQYARIGIDIPEGYHLPEHEGKKAGREVLFHREAEDIYHISKINDTNYIVMACRKWGLRITDVMQSAVFGIVTDEMKGCDLLNTRFDHDEMFGTVLNRFITQVVSGHPLTIYGTGHQRTGLMALRDVITSLTRLMTDIPERGTHRVINHASETDYSINELANVVMDIAKQNHYDVKMTHEHDPRAENDTKKAAYKIATHYLDTHLQRSCLIKVTEETFGIVERYKSRINSNHFIPVISWGKSDNKVLRDKINDNAYFNTDIINDDYWEAFRKDHFPSAKINLNPGTLGTVSAKVISAKKDALHYSEMNGFPLAIYQDFSHKLNEITSLCGELWHAPEYEVSVTHSITQVMNLLSLSMLRVMRTANDNDTPYKVATTTHEHHGGISSFELLPEYEVHYIPDYVMADLEKLAARVKQLQPDVFFMSHVFYDTGNLCSVNEICSIIRANANGCKIIIDAAQSLGLYELPTGKADVIVSSMHKWLFGAYGGGIVWIKNEFAAWIGGLHFGGQHGNDLTLTEMMKSKGGLDFEYYVTVAEALKLYLQTGKETVFQRSCYLADFMRQRLQKVLDEQDLHYVFLNDAPKSPVVSIGFTEYDPYPLYQYLNKHNIHIKCIKDHRIDGTTYHILRIGLPYYESKERLAYTVGEMAFFIREQVKMELV